MRTLNLIIFTSLVCSAWCGMFYDILNNVHSKLYGHDLHGRKSRDSTIVNINNYHHTSQKSSTDEVPKDPRGDYGSLSDDNIEVSGSIYFKTSGNERGSPNSGSSNNYIGSTEGDIRSNVGIGHQVIVQKFGYNNDKQRHGKDQDANSSLYSTATIISVDSNLSATI